MSYFSNFNTINYDIKGIKFNPQFTPITNILTRVRMKTEFIKNKVYYSDYMVVDGETPESLAHDFYGDAHLAWIVMYAQMITNPYYDWPLKYYDLTKYIAKKYGTDQLSPHHYENSDGWEVDATSSGAQVVTNFKYEEIENDKRRAINLVRPEFVNAIRKEFKKLIN